jgi:flavin reductase (DIM6/NTAB) family NADH-FMN oxidoreductase RutF
MWPAHSPDPRTREGAGHLGRGFARAAGRHVFRALAAAGGQHAALVPTPELPTPEPPAQAFTDAMAELVSGVCVVTACGGDGQPYGLVATSLCSYSAHPPSVLVCVSRDGRAGAAVASAPAFGAHLLCEDQEHIASWFARPNTDKFAAVDWAWEDGVPVLARNHVLAYLRCTRAMVKRHGDHAIVIGEVERIETEQREPLVYLRRRMDWRLGGISDP